LSSKANKHIDEEEHKVEMGTGAATGI